MRDIVKYIAPYFLAILFMGLAINSELSNAPVSIVILGLLCIYYFNLDQSESNYKHFFNISGSLFTASLLWISLDQNSISLSIALLASILFAIVYLLRFRVRSNKYWIDYVKVFGIIGVPLVLVLSTFYNLKISSTVLLIILSLAYIFDRSLIRKTMNRATQITTFSLLSLALVSFIVFAFIKANEADLTKKEAQRLQTEVVELRSQAEEFKEAAMMAAAQARQAEADALRAVVECEAKMSQ